MNGTRWVRPHSSVAAINREASRGGFLMIKGRKERDKYASTTEIPRFNDMIDKTKNSKKFGN